MLQHEKFEYYKSNHFLPKSQNILLVKDENHRFVAFNDTFSTLTGIKPSELIGLSDFDMIWRNYADFYIDHELAILAGEDYSVIEPLNGTHNIVLHTERKIIYSVQGVKKGTFACASIIENEFSIIEHLGGKPTILKLKPFETKECKLTSMESKVTYLLMRGFTRRKVALILNVMVKSLDFHQENIKNKLELNSSQEIIIFGFKHGWEKLFPFSIRHA